jgi:hypothetical protein
MAILSALFVIQRFAFKIYADLNLTVDDWMTLIAELACVPATVINIYGAAPSGIGRDFWTLTSDQRTNFFRNLYSLQLLYLAHVSLLKLALLAFFVRMFIGKNIRLVLVATITFVTLYGIGFVTIAAVQCTPVSFFWNMWDLEHEGHCIDSNVIAWTHAAINIALDIWMLAIPLYEIQRLNLDWKKKAGVALMFIVGALYVPISPYASACANRLVSLSSASCASSTLSVLALSHSTQRGTASTSCCGRQSRFTQASSVLACHPSA